MYKWIYKTKVKSTKEKCTKDKHTNDFIIAKWGGILEFKHKPVMLEECIKNLNIKPDGIYVDGTLRRCRS